MAIALPQVGAIVDVDVAHAVEVLDHRHARLFRNHADQSAAARNDQIDEPSSFSR